MLSVSTRLREVARSLAVLALASSLFSCAGSSSGESIPSTASQEKGRYDESDHKHLLGRVAFGVTETELARIEKLGVEGYIDYMLDRASGTDQAYDRRMLARSAEKASDPRRHEIIDYWLNLMMETQTPLREVMALFWHDYFATSQTAVGYGDWYVNHLNTVRRHSLGNLRQFLYAMSTDWIMLHWLDGVVSTAEAPNENFAREFFELFTLGADNGYTEEDIAEASRVFTGFNLGWDHVARKRTIEWKPWLHDSGDKLILGEVLRGRSGPDSHLEYLDMVHHVLAHGRVAEWVATRLFQHFVHTEPSEETIVHLAAVLRANDWEIRPLMKAILLSEEFFSSEARHAIVKGPVEFAVGFVRTTGLKLETRTLNYRLADAGQRLTFPPSVFGWDQGEAWLTSQGMVERSNILREVLAQARDYQRQRGQRIEGILPPSRERSAANVVDHLAGLLAIELTADERLELIHYLNHDAGTRQGEIYYFQDAFDGGDPEHLDSRVRGLLYILGQHPSYHTR